MCDANEAEHSCCSSSAKRPLPRLSEGEDLALKILILKVSSISYLRTRLKQMFAERMNAQK
jgi:hypothetical protein